MVKISVKFIFSGILLSRGDVWKAKRKLMSPAFHHEKMENIFKICVDCSERLVNKWNKYAEENKVFELHAELTKVISVYWVVFDLE